MSQTASQDAVSFLQSQHDDVRQLFATIGSTRGEQRRDAFEPLVRLLAVHETAEEMVVYPAIRSAEGGQAIVEARLQEEDQAKKTLTELEKLDVDSEAFDRLFTEFRAAVEAHAQSEEHEVFPLLQTTTDEKQLERMGMALKAAEGIAPTHPHKLAPESATGNLLVGPFVSVVDRVRDVFRDVMR
jgi:hemerythrin superfamily protein